MVVERRVFSRLPVYLQTDQNNRSTFISDDVMFEPERAGFVNGYVGDTSVLTESDLERLPPVFESTAARQKYQLSLGAVLIDPDTENRSGGAFYPDLIGQISANGGITDDPNRLFETPFYAWSPPFDYDKHINFTRYYWTGAGSAQVNGEYITKEPQGSQTVLFEVTASGFESRAVEISSTAPVSPTVGDLWEDVSDSSRPIFRWDGSTWVGVPFTVEADVPTSTTGFLNGDFIYVPRTGPEFNRPLMWLFSEEAGRWIAQPIVTGPLPDIPSEGMIWEDTTLAPTRIIRVYTGGAFTALTWSAGTPSGIAADGTYVYDERNLSETTDGWSSNNWWRHFEDLSPADREALQSGDQAIRPIIEFWAGIESVAGDTRDFRNDTPVFEAYRYDFGLDEIVDTGTGNTLFQYQIGTGNDDLVLGFPVAFNSTGEFLFDLTMETTEIAGATGYRYFRDTFTGLTHSIWAKAETVTQQEIDADGLAEVPVNITANSDHEILTTASRSRMLNHMAGVLSNQSTFSGNEFGLNNFRWTRKNPTLGATIIDCENTLLRTLATLQRPDLSIPDVTRRVSRDYNRVLVKFGTRLTQLWNNLTISNPDDTLSVTPSEAVDAILTELFIGRSEDFSYFNSDMGQYTETQISGGISNVISTIPRPIFIPTSPARTGSGPTYRPRSFIDRDGKTRLRGHEGVIIESFGDDRDLVWLELQNRFYDAVPNYYRDETATFSSRHGTSNFYLSNHYGNSTPNTTGQAVVDVVADFNDVVAPSTGDVYFDTGRGVTAVWSGTRFLTSPVQVDDVFLNTSTGEYFIYNGFGAFQIDRFERPFAFDYTMEEYRQILRREFERWAVFQNVDFVSNDQFDDADPFTWNYRSAGFEGHYQGIYLRLYRTVRPHSHPWEVVGYHSEPDWWQTSYVPTSVASDGTPRYADTHPMWADFQAGVFNALTGESSDQFVLTAPIPVDASGELLNPIDAGIVPIDNLVPERRDDSWVYGDGAPVEQQFLSSSNFAFATALLGYLMKPGRFVDTTWSELYIDAGVNGANPLWKAPHVVHRDTLTRPSVNDLPVHLEVTNGVVEKRLGINAWISEYARILGNDVTEVFGKTIRNTEISPGWRTAGFVNPDRTVIQTLSGIKIPFEDVHTILHRSPPTSETFGSGMLVTREGTGYRVFGFDLFNPFFDIDAPVVPISGGQVELRETFMATLNQRSYQTTEFTLPRNVQDNDTAKLGVLINGQRLKPQHITVTGPNSFEIENIVAINAGDEITAVVLTTQSNPSTKVKQFVINGVPFPYIDAGRGVTERFEYGHFFETAPDVINFMLGYGRQLTQRGWVFEDEVTTGTLRDWLFGAKQFATWVLSDTSQEGGEDFFFSPFMASAKFQSQFGQVLNVEALQNGAYGIIDQEANPIDPEQVFTSRIGNQITMTPNEGAPEIFGVRVLVAEDQHVVFLSNITKFNDLIYDPVIALFQSTLRVEAYRSQDWAGRLEADGFVINQGDLLPNFEKQAKDITRFYDRIDTLDDPVKRDQARELYGWYPNDTYVEADGTQTPMMDAIGAEERSRFDYHRGMVHSKGTIRPLIAFSKGTRIGRDQVIVYEDWAWRWCEFGDTRFERVQFRINKADFREQIQIVEFNAVENPLDTAIQVELFDRNAPDDGRWIIPPTIGDDGVSPFTFPIISPENPFLDSSATRFSVNVFDTETNLTTLSLFNYAPHQGLYDPNALCELDYIGNSDPARYTDGGGSEYSDGIQWGPEQVGTYWWDQTRLEFMDYLGQLPDYNAVARDWGRLKYFQATIIPDAEIGTVETLDPYTGAAVAHNLTDGDEVVISGAVPDEYNGEYEVTVTSPTTFEITIFDALDTPATGDVRVTAAFVDIYQWVESPVRPNGWASYIQSLSNDVAGAPSGEPIHGDDTSFVTSTVTNDAGRATTVYYFWIRGNTGDNNTKGLRADQVTSRIQSPTRNNVGWFGVVDEEHMFVFNANQPVQDGYGIEIITDSSELDYHTEWLLISEGDQFNEVPEIIREKLIDCLAGADRQGITIPSPNLTEAERFGTSEFPPQTVFPDRAEAITVLVAAANTLLNRVNLNTQDNLTGIFPLADEGTYWVRSEYRNEDYEGKAVLDTVATEAIRTDRLNQGRYFTDDLVKVLQSSNTDLWDGSQTDSTYVADGDAFIEVGVNNATLNITLDGTTDPAIVRSTFEKVYGLLDKEQQNNLVFTMLYEMLRQTPDADWFMKTSYITTQIFDQVDQSPFIRPNEVEALIANINDLKPYRTKLRSSTFTYTVGQTEDVGVQINEFPDKKITLRFDRLNCALEDEAGWDRFAWDTEIEGWDKPLWDRADLGRSEYVMIAEFAGDPAATRYTIPVDNDPTLYQQVVTVRQGSDVINLSDLGITATITKDHTQVFLELSAALTGIYTIRVEQSTGFYQGGEPTLGPQFEDTLFQAVPSSYRHHVPRLQEAGFQAPFPSMDDCYLDPPQSPEERIPNDVNEGAHICVITDWTPAYRGWDTTPFDSTPFDEAPSDIGRRVFYMSIGGETEIPAGLEVFSTSEDVIVSDERFTSAGQPYDIVRVDLNSVQITEGDDFVFVEGAPWVIEFLPRDDIQYIADGATTSFDISTAINGIDEVFKNNIFQTPGVDYTLVGSDIVFTQPAPSVISVNAYTRGRHFTGNAIGADFPAGVPEASLNQDNTFVFLDGDLQNFGVYEINDADVAFDTAPPDGSDVILFTLGNDVEDNGAKYTATIFTGDGSDTAFTVPSGTTVDDVTAWVFLDGRYQVLGTDYTIPVIGTVQFAVAPPNGAQIEIRALITPAYTVLDHEHIVFDASGGASDPIPGITDVEPNSVVVFVGDEIQNAYSGIATDFVFINGNPDSIVWNTPPTAGTKITVRITRSVTIAETVSIGVEPVVGDVIRVVQNPLVGVGDTVTFYYNNFPVGPLGDFVVNFAPTDYDVVDGVMTIDGPFPNGFINLSYPNSRRGTNPTSLLVRMTNVVDLTGDDHLIYDGALGSETDRRVGLRFLNQTDQTIYEWDGSGWNSTGTIAGGDQTLVLGDQQIVEYNGTTFGVVFNTGDNFTTPPVLQYPLFGTGITSGTYSLGQTANAATDFPEAYEVVQHTGDC